ncbi:MAG TPA: hypothetical protein VHL11_19290, partial [Phototrophicaceae bacterium]|nr:hypothetical protein [Phototrophicaceae bacterium]
MKFVFEGKPSDSPLVDTIWRTESEGSGSFISVAQTRAGIVITKQKGKTWLTVRGPETRATAAPIPEDAEFFGIVFKHGTFMPQFPARDMVDCSVDL